MKKYLIMLVTLLTTFVGAGAAFAATHTGFAVSTAGCAGCHVTHAASAQKLLKTGVTQTGFCYSCHGKDSVGSPYDVDEGDVNGAVPGPSYAGGFGIDATSTYTETSRHDVEDLVTVGVDLVAASIPGNSTANDLTGGLRCGSCHDPHGDNTTNQRLLRAALLGTNVNTGVAFTIDANLLPTIYDLKINAWCGGCHGKFDKANNSGHDKTGDTMYRHAMGVALKDMPTSTSFVNGTPVSNYNVAPGAASNKVVCLSCHRAHGTDKVSALSYNRDAGGTGTSSVLLRLKDRDVCYNCHGAANTNKVGFGE